jgi:hypothetical protein
MITFSSCSIAANSFTCPSAIPRSHFPVDRDRRQQVLHPSRVRQFPQPAADDLIKTSASVAWTRVRIRVLLGAMISRRSGWGLPPSCRSTPWAFPAPC